MAIRDLGLIVLHGFRDQFLQVLILVPAGRVGAEEFGPDPPPFWQPFFAEIDGRRGSYPGHSHKNQPEVVGFRFLSLL